jgi:adenine-specific DNA methylase
LTQAEFKFRRGNPDVLTSIANLSNDEVFTPPEFANKMLDTLEEAWAASNNGANIWEDSTVTFLDPFTKSGVFLREITERLTHGLEKQIPDLQERVNHILTKQVYGIAITQLTSLLARRSVYCSKWANGEHSIVTAFDNPEGNIWFERKGHTWVGGKDRMIIVNEDGLEERVTTDGKCSYCGANQRDYDRDGLETYAYPFLHEDNIRIFQESKFGEIVKFDVVIGNPPYQLGQSGGDSVGGFAMPIYQKFVEAAKSLDPRYITMVTPSRWFAGGRGLDEFRTRMLSDKRISVLVDFPNSADVFPGVDVKGGVSYFLWDSNAYGPCSVTTVEGEVTGQTVLRHLDEYDVLIRRNEALSILKKVLEKVQVESLRFLSEDVSPIQPFSIRTSYRGKEQKDGLKNPVLLFQNGGTSYIDKAEIPRNIEWVDQWKVLLARASGSGNDPHVIGKPIVAPPNSACTETYLVVSRCETEVEASNFASYLKCKFPRFLLSLRKYTQDLFSERFSFVPQMDISVTWTDDQLYEYFDLTSEEIEYINSVIRPMGDTDE